MSEKGSTCVLAMALFFLGVSLLVANPWIVFPKLLYLAIASVACAGAVWGTCHHRRLVDIALLSGGYQLLAVVLGAVCTWDARWTLARSAFCVGWALIAAFVGCMAGAVTRKLTSADKLG